jgi:hypothetical protein
VVQRVRSGAVEPEHPNGYASTEALAQILSDLLGIQLVHEDDDARHRGNPAIPFENRFQEASLDSLSRECIHQHGKSLNRSGSRITVPLTIMTQSVVTEAIPKMHLW